MTLTETRWRMEEAKAFSKIWTNAALAVFWVITIGSILLSVGVRQGVNIHCNVATGGSIIHVEDYKR